MDNTELAKRSYEASRMAAGQNLDGKSIPSWDGLAPAKRALWEAAAGATYTVTQEERDKEERDRQEREKQAAQAQKAAEAQKPVDTSKEPELKRGVTTRSDLNPQSPTPDQPKPPPESKDADAKRGVTTSKDLNPDLADKPAEKTVEFDEGYNRQGDEAPQTHGTTHDKTKRGPHKEPPRTKEQAK
jgi:hypothetical protein